MTLTPRGLTVAGLIAGVAGIGLLWASGVEFPFYPPPGMLILTAGALVVGLVRWAWAPAIGAFLGLFIIGGFILSSVNSGAGTDNLTGSAGPGGVIGTVIQLLGSATALIAGVLAVAPRFRKTSSGTPRR